MSEKRKLIEDIKQEYLDEKNKTNKTIENFWSQYQKMAKELSEGIYSDNNHFIYELIQNAEDTNCNEKEHILEFTLNNKGLTVFNNEDGFSEEQIKAICAFGKSTKAIEKNKGYIGEKGIGFKSVFKITEKPAINSNGYRFYFNRYDKSGETEYIIPYWIDNEELKKYPNEFQNNTHTTLYLPFAKNRQKDNLQKLKNDIVSIEPITLLFLKKLTTIKINYDNKIINIHKKKKKDENLNLITIKSDKNKDKYFIFKKSIQVKKNLDEVKNKDGRRKNIEEREIILAFPHFKNQTQEDRIFSFLPTKLHSGLNFIIQADFILQSGRESIAVDNEWNQWQFIEIENFINTEVIKKFKEHSKIKFSFLDYFLQYNDSNNVLVQNLYENLLIKIKQQKIILADNESWQQPSNIILLEDNIKIDTKYLKLLFGDNYEQVHSKFKLDEFFIDKFNIKRVNKEKLLNQIFIYLNKYNELNSYNTEDVFYLTKIISKYLNFGRDSRKFDEDYLENIKKALPIIPKYKTDKKFYLFDSVYISSEYKPKFLIENIAKENEFDFTKYNFLSDDYLKDKRLTDFIKNIIDEQEKHKNKKTIEFFTKYSDVLQNYLRNNINNYKKVFDFLIEIQEDNKERISKIPLLLTQNDEFYNSTKTIYFSNDSDSNLDILDKNLFKLIKEEQRYKEFLDNVFKVKEADILNIILNEYLPWIRKNYNNRTTENDKKLLKYTKDIIENFDKFEQNEKQSIKKGLFFISSNQKEKYLKSSDIYLSQNLTDIIFNSDSIEKYITDKSYFDFLDELYDEIIEKITEEKTKEFFKYFSFEKNIKESDIPNFIRFVKTDLNLDLNIEALEFIAKSIDSEDRKKIKEIEKFKVFSNKMKLFEVKNIFMNKIDNLEIDYLHSNYKSKLTDLYFKNIKQYFQSEYRIEPFITYLKQDINFDEAIKVYKYLDSKSSDFDPNKTKKSNDTITENNIRKKFKNSKLIYSKDNKYYPTDVTWKEEKSANQLFALSTIYPQKLQDFFIKKVQVSQTKDIKQIINQINEIKEKNRDYYDLLVDLNDLVSDNSELDKYRKSYNNSIDSQCDKNIYENAKQFILKKEKIFILDNGKKNIGDDFYFNDLDIEIYKDNLKSKSFSFSESGYSLEYFKSIIKELNIKTISSCETKKKAENYIKSYPIQNYREILNFAYDLLFTKYKDNYKKLDNRGEELEKVNLLRGISIYEKIETHIIIDGEEILFNNRDELYIVENNILKIIDENLIFKLLAKEIGSISDKDLKDFYNEVVNGNKSKEEYYKDENIKEKQNFILDISENNEPDRSYDDFKEDKDKPYVPNDIKEPKGADKTKLSAEEERKQRQKSGAEQVKGYNRNVSNNQNETSPSNLINTQEYKNKYIREKTEKLQKISNNSQKLSKRTRARTSNSTAINYKVGEEETKDFFRKKDQYLGQCQICGFTFTTKSRVNYCERFTWSDYQRVKVKADLIDAGNSLCLCAKCHSIIKGGGDFEATFLTDEILEMLNVLKDDYDFDTFIEDIDSDKLLQAPECFKEHIEFNDMYFVDIRLNNNDERIYFTEEHLLMFFEFLKSS